MEFDKINVHKFINDYCEDKMKEIEERMLKEYKEKLAKFRTEGLIEIVARIQENINTIDKEIIVRIPTR